MSKAYILLADGFEEVEALATVDVLRRAGVDAVTVSINPQDPVVCGSHNIRVYADVCLGSQEDDAAAEFTDADAVILPGGKRGTDNLGACGPVHALIKAYYDAGKLVCAICAAPTVLAMDGILDGLEVTCYPGFENKLADAIYVNVPVKVTGNIITGRSMGTAVEFGLVIAEKLVGRDRAEKTAASLHR